MLNVPPKERKDETIAVIAPEEERAVYSWAAILFSAAICDPAVHISATSGIYLSIYLIGIDIYIYFGSFFAGMLDMYTSAIPVRPCASQQQQPSLRASPLLPLLLLAGSWQRAQPQGLE